MALVVAGAFAAPAGTLAQSCDRTPARATPFLPELADSGRLFRGVFTRDGRELYFFKKTGPPNGEDYRIFRLRRGESGWSKPERLRLGEEASDLYPALSPDGRLLVFSSYRRAPGDTSARPNASLWLARRMGDGWDRPEPIAALAKPGYYHSQVAFTGDGRLHFRRVTPDWRGRESLVSRLEDGRFSTPTESPEVARWLSWRSDLLVHGGEPVWSGDAVLLDVSRRDPATGRAGPSDIWISVRRSDGWSDPVTAGLGVNDEAAYDNFPTITADGCGLVWVRGFSAWHQVRWPALLRELTG